MNLKPSLFKEQIITPRFFQSMLMASIVLTVAILGIFYYYKDNVILAQTMVFCAVVCFEMLRIVNIRAEYNLSIFSNKYLLSAVAVSLGLQILLLYLPISIGDTSLQTLFKVQPLQLVDWSILIGVGLIIYLTMRLVIKPLENSKLFLGQS